MMINKENEEPVKSLLAIATGFEILFLFTKWEWLLLAGIIVGLTGIVSPYLTKKIHFLWMKLAFLLNLVIPKIILGIIFYFLLTPISFFARLFRKIEPLRLHKQHGSTFNIVNNTFPKNSFDRTW